MCDKIIVILHGGIEYYPFPSPELQDKCHFLIEEGADIIVCQHTHCAGCIEEYLNGYIIYGQGNLIFHNAIEKNLGMRVF